jgi:hypothetical protein
MILSVFVPIDALSAVHSDANLAQIFQKFHFTRAVAGSLSFVAAIFACVQQRGGQLCGKKAPHQEKNYQQLWISEVLQKQRALIDSIHSTMNSCAVDYGKILPNRDDFCLTNLTGKI